VANKLQELIRQMQTHGNIDPTSGTDNDDTSAWQKSMAQAAMAQKMDWQTLLGLLAGKALRGGFDTWKENYDARGEVNDLIASKSPDEINAEIVKIEKNNPNRAAYMRDTWQRKTGQSINPTEPQVNSSALQKRIAEIIPQLEGSPNADWLNQPDYSFNNPTDPAEIFKRLGWGAR